MSTIIEPNLNTVNPKDLVFALTAALGTPVETLKYYHPTLLSQSLDPEYDESVPDNMFTRNADFMLLRALTHLRFRLIVRHDYYTNTAKIIAEKYQPFKGMFDYVFSRKIKDLTKPDILKAQLPAVLTTIEGMIRSLAPKVLNSMTFPSQSNFVKLFHYVKKYNMDIIKKLADDIRQTEADKKQPLIFVNPLTQEVVGVNIQSVDSLYALYLDVNDLLGLTAHEDVVRDLLKYTYLDENMRAVIPQRREDRMINDLNITDGVYVDCDNIDFFTFTAFLRKLSDMERDTPLTINMFIDRRTAMLWRGIINTFKTDNIEYNPIFVDYIRAEKSCVDVVIASTLTSDRYTKGVKRAMLISSDSDFAGLIKTLRNDITFSVSYNKDSFSSSYLAWLNENNIMSYALNEYAKQEGIEEDIPALISGYVIDRLYYLPISKWDANVISESVCTKIGAHMLARYSQYLNEEVVKENVERVLKNITVEMREGTPHIVYTA